MPAPSAPDSPGNAESINVPIGRWAVAAAPAQIRTLLGSCVGVVLYDPGVRVGGLAHIVLPDSRGSTEQPGKFADTAIPGMLAELQRLIAPRPRGRWLAKVVGGASMFQMVSATAPPSLNIGQMNQEAVERILADLRIPVQARDLGGGSGRHLTLDTATGLVRIKIPGGDQREI